MQFLNKFHNLLQKSIFHYTFDEGESERLMLKYYEYLFKIKVFLKEKYNMDVLENIDDFPLNLDDNLIEYYKQIAVRIVKPSCCVTWNFYNDRACIQKIKSFFIKHHIFYEVTFTVANDKASKFDRVIAFASLNLSDNYVVKLSINNGVIGVLGKIISIQIIDSGEVSISPCEVNRFADFLTLILKSQLAITSFVI